MLAVKGAKATTYSSFQIVKIILCQHLSVIWEARAAEWRDWERIRNPDIGVRFSSFQIAFISFDPRRSTGSSAGAAVMLATESTGNSPWLAQSLAAANGGKGTVTRPPHHQDTAPLSASCLCVTKHNQNINARSYICNLPHLILYSLSHQTLQEVVSFSSSPSETLSFMSPFLLASFNLETLDVSSSVASGLWCRERWPLAFLFLLPASGLPLLLWFWMRKEEGIHTRGLGVKNNILAKTKEALPAPGHGCEREGGVQGGEIQIKYSWRALLSKLL